MNTQQRQEKIRRLREKKKILQQKYQESGKLLDEVNAELEQLTNNILLT